MNKIQEIFDKLQEYCLNNGIGIELEAHFKKKDHKKNYFMEIKENEMKDRED